MVGLFLLSALVAAATGGIGAAWTAVLWWPPEEAPAARMWVGLVVFTWIKAWTLWQVFSAFPAVRRLADRQAVWLRRVLYLAAADLLVLWLLPDIPHTVLSTLVWVSLFLLFARVPVGISSYGLPFAYGAVVALAAESAGQFEGFVLIFAVCPLICQILILLGQKRDGRWSAETVSIGWKTFWVSLALPLMPVVLDMDWPLATLLTQCAVVQAAWLARSAAELTDVDRADTDTPTLVKVD